MILLSIIYDNYSKALHLKNKHHTLPNNHFMFTLLIHFRSKNLRLSGDSNGADPVPQWFPWYRCACWPPVDSGRCFHWSLLHRVWLWEQPCGFCQDCLNPELGVHSSFQHVHHFISDLTKLWTLLPFNPNIKEQILLSCSHAFLINVLGRSY